MTRVWIGTLLLLMVPALQGDHRTWAQTQVLKEPQFAGLSWGMSQSAFSGAYRRAGNIVASARGYVQDLSLPLHGCVAIAGFDFGSNDRLRRVIASLVQERSGIRLDRNGVLNESSRILSQLDQLYGKAVLNRPWNGQALVHVWVRSTDVITFAYNGSDGWGIHYRSRAYDPDVAGLLEALRSQGIRF